MPRRFRYRRQSTVETLVVAILFVTALLAATFFITGRDDAPQSNGDTPGNWKILSSGTTANLLDVVFVDSENGWAVGDGGAVLHTSDGGDTWGRQDSGTEAKLTRVAFTSPSKGWAVGKLGVIIYTSDGGVTWERQGADSTMGLNLAGVSFVDEQTGWVVTERGSVMLNTSDGGKTWTRQFLGNTSARSDMAFINSRRGWIVFTGGDLLHTSDGGDSWERQSGVAAKVNLGTIGVFFLDENNGWIAGWRGRSSDLQSGLQFRRFLSDGMVARTTDGGETWTRHDSQTGRFLWDVAFVDAQEGWAVGSFGTILYSDDGGVNWEPQFSGTEETLQGLVFIDNTLGWAVGEGGVILRYTRR